MQKIGAILVFALLIMTSYCEEEGIRVQQRLENLEVQMEKLLQQIVPLAAMVRILKLIF